MRRLSIPCLLLAAAATGCADPAKDQPKAAVAEPAPVPAPSDEARRFEIAKTSEVLFVGSKVTGSHDGGFKVFAGEVRTVGDDPTRSSVSVSIDTTSLWSDNERLTGHLKSADFFEVETYPTATFQSTEVVREGAIYRMTGNLTLHGVTKSVSFPVDINIGPSCVTARAKFSINRFDFGIVYPGKAEDLIRDEVVIKLNITAYPEGAAPEQEPAA
jgi:polyisoprenoid-binding protein YceI